MSFDYDKTFQEGMVALLTGTNVEIGHGFYLFFFPAAEDIEQIALKVKEKLKEQDKSDGK